MAKSLKKDREPENAMGWLTTYSDMMTILFVLFVLLFSMSTINHVQWDLLIQTIGNRPREAPMMMPFDMQEDDDILSEFELKLELERDQYDQDAAEERDDFDYVFQLVTMFVAEHGYADVIEIERADNYIMIRFGDRVLFAPGRADIGSEGRRIVAFMGAAIGIVLDQVDTIKIEGHTDSVPQSGRMFADNWILGSARANAVRHIFEADARLPSEAMRITSFADTVPLASNDTPEGRSKNRRVEVYITRTGSREAQADAEVLIGAGAH